MFSNLMLRPHISNRTFEYMGEGYGPYIDAGHFLGHSALGTPWHHKIPLANIKHEEGEAIFEIAIPGFAKEDLSVKLQENILAIAGIRKAKAHAQETYLNKEFELCPFEVKFRLNEPLDLDTVRAEYKSGILRLFFRATRKTTEIQVRQINVA
jgi:HSP20 family protein